MLRIGLISDTHGLLRPEALAFLAGCDHLVNAGDIGGPDIVPAEAGVQVMVSGHSHKPSLTERAGVLYVNPGSAGPRRFTLPISVGELRIAEGRVTPRLVTLVPDSR